MQRQLKAPVFLALLVVGAGSLIVGLKEMVIMADSYVAGSDGRFLWMLAKVSFGALLLAFILVQPKTPVSPKK
jgi:hypothetical protein